MITSVGIFLINKYNKILIGHPTKTGFGAGHWTIPKGKMEDGESTEQTAKREFFEETGLSIDGFPDGTLEYLGEEEYRHKKKRLLAYIFRTSLPVTSPVCESLCEINGKQITELDAFFWATYDEAFEAIHYTQANILRRNKDKFDEPK